MPETPHSPEGQDFVAPDESQRIEDIDRAHDMAKASNKAHSKAATERRLRANVELAGATLEKTQSEDSIKKEVFEERAAEIEEIKASSRHIELEVINGMSSNDLVTRIEALREQHNEIWAELSQFEGTVRYQGANQHLATPVYSGKTAEILNSLRNKLISVDTMLEVDQEKIKEIARFPNNLKDAFRKIFPSSRG